MTEPATATVGDMLRRTVDRHAPREALVWQGRSRTWDEVAAGVTSTARWLDGQGLTTGDRVAIALPTSPAFVEVFLAALTIGAVAVPLNPSLTEAEVRTLIEETGAVGIVALDGPDGVAWRAEACSVPILRVSADGSAPARTGGDLDPHPNVDATADALVGFSSGSTGAAKRVVRAHGNLTAEADAFGDTLGVTVDDRILAAVPLFHAHGLGNALLAAVRSGAALHLEEQFRRDRVLEVLESARITIFPSVPFALRVLASSRRARSVDLGSVRLCLSAGAPLPPDVFDALLDTTGIATRQLYGCTEGGALTVNRHPDPSATRDAVGAPLDGVEVRILGSDGTTVGTGETGEIVVRAPSLAAGYEGGAAGGSSSFADGWFRSGDLGRAGGDGQLRIEGRIRAYISTNSSKVDPVEVERCVASLDGVAEAAVVGVPAADGSEKVKAVVVGEPGITRSAVVAHCRGQLAEFKVPGIIEFRDELPRSQLGKLLRKDLV